MSAGRMIGALVGSFGGRAIGGMIGGPTGRMVGSLLGSMVGGRGARGGLGNLGGLGSLGDLLGGSDDDDAAPVELPDDEALVLIRAMTNAAKADGNVDQDEIDNIVRRAGDLDGDDEAFLRAELASPLDLDAFIESVPSGMEAEVYTASLLPIEVDSVAETQYLRSLADGLGLREDQVADIHNALEIPVP